MDTNTTLRFKQQLTDERVRVEGELRDLGWEDTSTGEWEANGGDIDTTATESDEIADRIEELEERSGEIAPLKAQWKDVKRALKKIEDGEYGMCELGGEDIEVDRLEANPSARTCKLHIEAEGDLED